MPELEKTFLGIEMDSNCCLIFAFSLAMIALPTMLLPLPQQREVEEQGPGIIFNRVKTIILADRYEHVSFLLPFPELETAVSGNLTEATKILKEYWNAIPGDCPELHERVVPDTQSDELVTTASTAYHAAEEDIRSLHEELAQLLLPPALHKRSRRFVSILAAGAIGAGIVALGTQLADGCIAGVLGPCSTEKKVAQNRVAVREALKRLNDDRLRWTSMHEHLDEKFYLVASEMKEIRQSQEELERNQHDFWNATAATLEGLTSSVKTMTLCTEYLFSRSQMNLLRTTILARVQSMLSSIQSFRVALWAYKATLLDSIPGLSHGYLPMSLVPRATLLEILEQTTQGLAHEGGHLSLALSLDHILRYYETPLVRRVESTEDGLLLTVAIPLTSRELIMEVYEGIPLPMPTKDNSTATEWSPETRYLAVTSGRKENALLTKEHLENCIGHKEAAVCQQGFATTRNRDSCLATLFFHDAEAAMSTCEIKTVQLPRVETARHLGFGRWLITRQTPHFTLQLLSTGPQSPALHERQLTKVPGCRACILTLACGTELESDSLSLKADASSCNATGARRLDLALASPLANLFDYLPLNRRLPDYKSHDEARTHLFKLVQSKLPMPKDHVRTSASETLRAIAAPLARTLTEGGAVEVDLPELQPASWLLEIAIVCGISLAISLLVQISLTVCVFRRTKNRLAKKNKTKSQTRSTSNTSEPSAPPEFKPLLRPVSPLPELRDPSLRVGPLPRLETSRHMSPVMSPNDRLAVLCAAVNQKMIAPISGPSAHLSGCTEIAHRL